MERFIGALPRLPFNKDIESGSFVVVISPRQRPLVARDAFESPEAEVSLVLFDVVDDLVVGQYFFVLVAVDGTSESNVVGMICEVLVMLQDHLENLCTESLSVFLRRFEEGATYQARWVKGRERRLVRVMFAIGL